MTQNQKTVVINRFRLKFKAVSKKHWNIIRNTKSPL